MAWVIAILKAIPALKRLGELLERNIRSGRVESRRKAKMDRVDDAIADALATANERVHCDEDRPEK